MEEEPIYDSLLHADSRASAFKRKYEKKLPSNQLISMSCLVAMGGSFSFGYQLVITNPAQEAFVQFINESLLSEGQFYERTTLENYWGGIISFFFWGCTCGALLISTISQKLGRKNGIQLSHILHIISCLISIASYYYTNHRIYAISRFLIGIAFSISLGIGPMYIAECSPKSCRGLISMVTGIFLQAGLVVGAIVAMPHLLGTPEKWWILYAMEAVLTCIAAAFIPFTKESPGYLLSRQKYKECEQSIVFYHQITEDDAKKLMNEMKSEKDSGSSSYSIFEVWKDANGRRGTLLGVIIMLAMVMSGIAAINAFAFEILLSTGLSVRQSSYGNILICLMSLIGILCSSAVIDRFGRRYLLLVTNVLLGITNILIFIFMNGYETTKNPLLGYGLVIAISFFNFCFAAGPGPISLFITSELVSQRSRDAACTWTQTAMSITRSFVLTGYLPLKNCIGQPQAYLLLFFPPMVIVVVILYFYLPETKGKTPNEIVDSVNALPSLRKKRVGELNLL